jgi:hypothetical protein
MGINCCKDRLPFSKTIVPLSCWTKNLMKSKNDRFEGIWFGQRRIIVIGKTFPLVPAWGVKKTLSHDSSLYWKLCKQCTAKVRDQPMAMANLIQTNIRPPSFPCHALFFFFLFYCFCDLVVSSHLRVDGNLDAASRSHLISPLHLSLSLPYLHSPSLRDV